MAQVIKKWFAEETPKDGVYVKIEGREAGLVAWLLALFKINPTVTFEVRKDHIVFEAASLSGYLRQVVPMRSLSRTYYGYEKPWKMALVIVLLSTAVAFSLLGFLKEPLINIVYRMIGDGFVTNMMWRFGGFFIFLGALALGVFAGRWFYENEQGISLGFVEISAWSSGVSFKPSFVEGQRIDEKSAERVSNIIRNLVDAQTHA